jgi:hypothetical protein
MGLTKPASGLGIFAAVRSPLHPHLRGVTW